jgi:Tfp pilus assembly protein PilV
LIETIVAVLVFTIGALALAASSAFVARAMGHSALQERSTRLALSRIEIIASQCAMATSGRETVEQIESTWTVAGGASLTTLTESVSCRSDPQCGATYHAVLRCSP